MKRASYRVLNVWLPNWPLQRLYADHPELRRNVLLYERYRGNNFRVVAYAGRGGIRPGMPLAEAKALAPTQCILHDPHADRRALLELAAWCEQFSPVVGIEGTDNLCLDVTGLNPIYGSEEALLYQVQQAFKYRGYSVRIAIADTLGAAWAIAHYGGKESGLFDLPIAALRISSHTIHVLRELGIHTIGQLSALSRADLTSRFEEELTHRLNQATGQIAEPITAHRPPPEVVAHDQLEYPTADRQWLDVVLGQLTKRVCDSLEQRQQGAIRLECKLRDEKGNEIVTVINAYQPTANPSHLLGLIDLQLSRSAIVAPVTAVQLSVLLSAPLLVSQLELFGCSRQEFDRQIASMVDRLSSRLGRHAVVRPIYQPDAQPEYAFRYEPLAGMKPSKRKTHPLQKLPRPLSLEAIPRALRVLSVVPHGPPIQFEWHGTHRVASFWGPERIQTAWWRGRYIQRDYYRVETTTGQRYWLFRRLHDSKWFLHGVFD